jgi:hypothetical protein
VRNWHRPFAAVTALCGLAAASGAQSVPEWRYTQELRIGSEGEGPAGFSDIRGIAVDRKGDVWVLEFSTQDIRVFDPAGKHLRTIGRKGHGPGEFIYADGMALAPDGLVWVHDPQNARFSIFDEEGKFVRQQVAVSSGFGFTWNGGVDAKGRIWDRLFVREVKDLRDWKMRRAAPDWSRVDTLVVPRCHDPARSAEESYFRFERGTSYANVGVPFMPGPVIAMDYRTEALWCAPTSAEYRLVKVGLERRDTLARLTGRAERLPVSDEERDSAIARIRHSLKSFGEISGDWSRIPRYKPLLKSAFVDDDGRLWVERTTPEGESSLFDIYTSEGRALAQVRVPYRLKPSLRPVVRGQTAWFIAQEEGEVPYVVRGRVGPR